MSKQDIVNYVMNTPHNINPAILNQKLGEMEVQPDWNQNNPTAPDYVKNRPFYTELVEEVILDGELEFDKENEWELHRRINRRAVDGEQVTIILNGVTYVCNFTYLAENDMYTALLPNVVVVAHDTYDDAWEYVVIAQAAATVKVVVTNEVVRKLDSKYLPDPFWVEEKRTLLVEGVPNEYSQYDVQSQLVVGKEYTYCIDGVEYTGKAVYEAPDFYVNLADDMDKSVCYVYDYCIDLNNSDILDPNEYHKFELIERVYHTYHDFMVIINRQEGENQPSNYKLVAGNFAEARVKILKGLPVTAYVCQTTTGEKYIEYINQEAPMTYYTGRGEEMMMCSINENIFGITSSNRISIL